MPKLTYNTPKKRIQWLIIAIAIVACGLVLRPILLEFGYKSGDELVAERIYDWREKLKLEELEQKNNLPRGLLSAVMHQESAGNPNAKSTAGAQGLFQFMRPTARDMGLNDRTHPEDSARAAAEYLDKLYERYNKNLELTLAAYNWGLGNVDNYIKTRPSGSTYERFRLNKMPEETQNYIARIKMLRTTYYLR
ncbi:lytic transglycosylase domain-containing protein [Hydromonas duriensis]|nr:lytic transglycosylase domain-containing protein [Hydromonas duriensis]